MRVFNLDDLDALNVIWRNFPTYLIGLYKKSEINQHKKNRVEKKLMKMIAKEIGPFFSLLSKKRFMQQTEKFLVLLKL